MESRSKQEPLLGISEAARLAGVNRQTVEYYLTLGLVTPIRSKGKRGRFFSAEHVRQIRIIHELNQTGLPLREIRRTFARRMRRS